MDVLAEVRRLVVQELNVDEGEVTPQASFQDALGADSLALVEITMALEEKFDISIPGDDAREIKTVAQAFVAIEKALQAKTTTEAPAGSSS